MVSQLRLSGAHHRHALVNRPDIGAQTHARSSRGRPRRKLDAVACSVAVDAVVADQLHDVGRVLGALSTQTSP